MNITNQSTIDDWSNVTDDEINAFGDEGDEARVSLIDPNVFDLIGDVQGKTVLDAGCGNGYLSRKLAKMGAKVTGIEPSSSLYQHCLEKEEAEPLGIEYLQQDISKLESSNKYDLVVVINVLMDIPEYQSALTNCVKSLKDGGEIVISILHPCFPGSELDWNERGRVMIGEYFASEPVKQKYGHSFARPLQEYFNFIIDSDCSIAKVVEPRAADDSRNAHVPQFLMVKAIKLK
jgi:2-polyprenyl-3-methyl-5-hydroxy-6-metoxy-1,4-benzoquinol methylase